MMQQHKQIRRTGQIWIETMLYTLIGIVLIGLVLSFVYPRIKASQEKILVEQTIETLNVLDESINAVLDRGIENVKSYEFKLSRGEMFIDGSKDEIVVTLPEMTGEYSQPGVEVGDGRIKILTQKGQQYYTVTLKLPLGDRLNLMYDASDAQPKKFTQAATSYKIFISNIGVTGSGANKKSAISLGETATSVRFADTSGSGQQSGTNTPPTVSITSPLEDAQFTAPAAVNIIASASDSDGISKVEFFSDGTKIGEDTSANDGWSFSWSAVPVGEYSLTAKATDAKTSGAKSTTSTPVKIKVNAIFSGLVGEWNFEEASWSGSVGEVRDISGKGNHGQAFGGVSPTSIGQGAVGDRAAKFDGSGEFIQIPSTGLLLEKDVTVMGWFKTRSLLTSMRGSFISKRDSFIIDPNFDGTVIFFVWTGSQWVNSDWSGTNSDKINTNQWEHWAATYNSDTKEIKLYKDGRLVAEKTGFSVSGSWSGNLCIGADCGISGRFLDGDVDEVRIYNKALSQNEIQAIYSSQK